MWDLIVSVPDHCLSSYFSKCELLKYLYKDRQHTETFDAGKLV